MKFKVIASGLAERIYDSVLDFEIEMGRIGVEIIGLHRDTGGTVWRDENDELILEEIESFKPLVNN